PIVSRTTGQVVGVVEVYKSPLRLLAAIQRARLVIWTISLAGALILYVVLFPLVRQVYGRQVREEALQAHAAELEAQVTARTRELEAQRETLFQAEKVAAMGQLLAGVSHELNNPLSTIVGDPHQLQQVIVNLLTNAHQALRSVPTRRRLTLTTKYARASDRILLEIADSGPGVPADIRTRIFDPFFTTKAPGQGTGLGLSLCRGIVDAHEGGLRLEATPGGGATFVVELPAGAPAEAAEAQRAVTAIVSEPGKAILVVDDEPFVADLLAEALMLDGHRVEAVNSGAAALSRILARDYDLVFSDMKMPGMSGTDLYDEAARRRPGIERRFVFVTGDTMNPTTRQFLERTGATSVTKPFDIDGIRRLVPQRTAAAARAEVALRS